MIVYRPQSAHRPAREIGFVFPGDIVVLFRQESRISTKLMQRDVKPFRENALHMIAIAGDRLLAAVFPNQMRFQISLPRLLERDVC